MTSHQEQLLKKRNAKLKKDLAQKNRVLEVEAALERVRSRSMGMQKSEELKEVIKIVYQQLTHLKINLDHSGFVVDYTPKGDWHFWIADEQDIPSKITHPYFKSVWANQFNEAKEKGADFFATNLNFEEKNKFYNELLSYVPGLPEASKNFYLSRPGLAASTVLFNNVSLYIENFSGTPYTDEENNILKRFGKVFQQTYIRFLDLQKAEAQAREGKIETALEKVRSRSLAMHQTQELQEVVTVVFEKLQELGVVLDAGGAIICTFREDSKDVVHWNASPDLLSSTSYKVPYFENQIFSDCWSSKESGADFFAKAYSFEEKNSLFKKAFECTDYKFFPDKFKSWILQNEKYALSAAWAKNSAILIPSHKGIFLSEEEQKIVKRFAKVFEQAYTRFLDLQKAEARAREAKIETALEKVRSRTMAMQHSDELPEAANVLFLEVQALGIPAWSCGYNVLTLDKKTSDCWMSSEGAIQEPFNLYFTEEDSFIEWYNFLQSEESFFVQELGGQALEAHYNYMRNIPRLGEVIKKLEDAGISLPTYQINHLCKFTYGFLLFITYEPVRDAHDLFKRFTKVFEQTYTRFLDLQKAEAQAREAQIEAALERVRSRSMGMQKSEELKEVIQIVFEQLRQLNFNIDSAHFNLNFKESDDYNLWSAAPNQPYPVKTYIPFFDHPVFIRAREAKEKGLDFFTESYTQEEKNTFFEHLFKHTPVIPDERRKYILSGPGVAASSVLMNSISLWIMNYAGTPYSEAENTILKRFGKIFEQSYSRFLDLQKAEAQAREAQIEAALEKVRSRSLAMHKSDELEEVISVVSEQLQQLQFTFHNVSFAFNNDHLGLNFWLASPADPHPLFIKVPYLDNPSLTRQLQARAKGDNFFADVLTADENLEWIQHVIHHSPLKDVSEENINFLLNTKGYARSVILMKHIILAIGNYFLVPYTNEQNAILKRFGNVFEQSYTRFLDLQKAETQSRENQIQLALERARSQSMIMQHSKELDDTLQVFHEQVQLLGINSAFSFLWLPNEEKNKHIFWAIWEENLPTGQAGENGSIVFKNKAINYPLDRNEPATKECLVDWKSDEQVHSYAVPPEGVENYFAAWQELIDGVERLKPEHFLNGLYYIEAFMKYGCFGVMAQHDLTQDEKKILGRFATEFERTYTRFLDLQKAEAQAREAQIEASLERVRSRSMGMRKSDELRDVIHLIYEQFVHLNIQINTVGFILDYKERDDLTFWLANKLGPSKQQYPYFESPHWNLFIAAKQKGLDFFADTLTFEEKNKFFQKVFGYIPNIPKEAQDSFYSSPGWASSNVLLKNVCLFIDNLNGIPFADADNAILMRFGKVFEQTYTRFLDLQKAEANVREAQIEAGLERLRARTMAMHSSEDVSVATATMLSELEKLNIQNLRGGILNIRHDETMEVWSVNTLDDGRIVRAIGNFDMKMHPLWRQLFIGWRNKDEFFHFDMIGKDKEDYIRILDARRDYLPNGIQQLPDCNVQSYFFGEGAVWTYSLQPHSEEDKQVMKRFTSVFSLTFRRYQDLKKAEAQAREARIEASLERVRSKTMAMHNSEDVTSATETMFDELKKLGIDNLRCGIANIYPNRTFDVFGVTNLAGGNKMSGFGLFGMDEHPIWQRWYESWKNKEEVFIAHLAGQEKKEYFNNINNHINYLPQQIVNFPDNFFQSYYFEQGSVWAYSLLQHSEPEKDIMKRFATGFSLTFRRYQDLKKAEAQAREATIEEGLERVRGKAMAMHSSNDLIATASMVFTELRKLGINPVRCGVSLQTKESRKNLLYYAIPSAEGDNLSFAGTALLAGHPVLSEVYDSWIRGEDYFPVLKGDLLTNYYQTLKQVGFDVPASPKGHEQYGYYLAFSEGMFYGWAENPFTETEIKIIKRFASVIDLTFRRYMELQKSETNSREAVKQAALDRIRAEIASMRTIADLERITPLIWTELNILGVPFIRCGVFIMGDSDELIHTFLSTPDGKAIAAFHIPYTTPGNIQKVLTHWQHKKNYIDHWDESAFTEFAGTLVNDGALTSPEEYLKTIPRGGFYLHFLPFLQGMLYVGNTTQLDSEQIKLIQSVADAFSTAYARYEDFNKLEAAKQQVDKTLVDLKQAQTQLVQSEKMASLGELTAGIAHEIQNPLNFVNNFSEVSRELLDEMKEEIEKGNTEEVKAIALDVIQNLEKINHHGKRADEIVKGMLQHSRASTGQKEPTNINALADEYLRLSYHGMRAKDKLFNATIQTDFDKNIGNINIVPQDIGRVLLNLYNNAFYAVTKKGKQHSENYEPTVSVSTKRINNTIELTVTDNGNGIPQNIVDKIFQPFFTTKPTGQGTGLGLSLSYDIVKAHGGEIKVKTKEGEGSDFIIQLPVV